MLKILRLEQRLPYNEIAKTLGRSEKSCHSSIRRHSKEEFEENLRLNLLSYVTKTACLDKKTGKIKNKFKRWTVEEDRIIVKSQPIEIKTLSKKLKRTNRGVLARIYELRKKGIDIELKKQEINKKFVEDCFIKNGG